MIGSAKRSVTTRSTYSRPKTQPETIPNPKVQSLEQAELIVQNMNAVIHKKREEDLALINVD